MRMSIKFIIGWMILSMVAINFPGSTLCNAASLYAQADLLDVKTRHKPEGLSTPEKDIPLTKVEKTEKKGFSKWVWIGLGVLAVGGAALALGGGGGGGGVKDGPDGDKAPACSGALSRFGMGREMFQLPGNFNSAPIRAASLDCQAGGVEQVVCEVYDATGNWLVTGGPWACEAGGGRIEGIPVGPDRIFVVLAEDELGNIRYQGETTGVSIEAGQNTQAVVIDAYLFIPTLSLPENAAQDVDLGAVSLEWELIENADAYLVQVAKDVDFETISVDETTPATVYAPPPLEPLTEYFWKISAVDMQANTGADSEVRSFVTSDCAYTILPAGNAFTNTGGTGSIDVTSSSSFCTWRVSPSESWITITSDSSESIESSDGTVTYSVAANPGAARSATITIADQTHTVEQEAAPCTYTISPPSQSVGENGGAYDVTVSATHSGCEWSTPEVDSWFRLSPTSGSGDGTVVVVTIHGVEITQMGDIADLVSVCRVLQMQGTGHADVLGRTSSAR
jgi:hypothetical protein